MPLTHSSSKIPETKLDSIITLADMLGPNEDYDGLICELDDYSLGMDDEDLFAVLAAI